MTVLVAILFGFAPAAHASSVSGVTAPTITTPAAGATGVEYNNIGFTVSPNGAMTAPGGTITLTGPSAWCGGPGARSASATTPPARM